MTTETLTLSDFLLARIAEDEETARAATPGPWEFEPERDTGTDQGPWVRAVAATEGEYGLQRQLVLGGWGHDWCGLTVEQGDADHIVRHDPARVLAECEAKRRIVERVHGTHNTGGCLTCDTLRFLALPYADHPDYREEWKP